MKSFESRLKTDGPMFCKQGRCPEFRKREPEFAKKMQDSGIIAHYMGKGWPGMDDEYWSLSGITPITRAGILSLMDNPAHREYRSQHTRNRK